VTVTADPGETDGAEQRDELHRRTLAKIRQLESLAAAVRSPRPLDAVIELVLEQISDVVPIDAAAVWLYDAENDLWYIGGARGLTRRASQVSFKSGQTLHAKVGEHGEIVTNLESAGFRRLYPEHDLIRSALYAPMKVAGRRVGLIALYRNGQDLFDDDDLNFVRTVGSHVGMAVSFAALEARAERLAVLSERARLGADLHDGILQILASVRVYAGEVRSSLEGVASGLDDAAGTAVFVALSTLEDCVDSGSADLTSAIAHLRKPDACLDLRRQLDVTRDRLEERGIAATVTCDVRDMASEVSDALSWIAREAASNILQHSRANRVKIEVRPVGTYVEMTISDNGVGPSSKAPSAAAFDERPLGQRIMRERAAQIGGILQVTGVPTGTTVWARIPAVPVHNDEQSGLSGAWAPR
jgi:two-component system nitrate/nitrite sensor histidine kinase NarX